LKNIQENNILRKRVNRFGTNTTFEEELFEIFDFNKNLKSDKIEELEFTNYLSSNQCDKYFILLEICKKLYENFNNINKLFVTDEFDSHRYNAQRVYDIMKAINNREIDKTTTIYKLKNKEDPEIQFYVSREKNILKLQLIDVYHIVIETVNRKNGRTDRKGIYNARANCKFDIKEIQEELEGQN